MNLWYTISSNYENHYYNNNNLNRTFDTYYSHENKNINLNNYSFV